MDAEDPGPPREGTSDPAPVPRRRSSALDRVVALIEIILCSGYPTQIVLVLLFALAGWPPAFNAISLPYVSALLLADSAIVLCLIAGFLRLHGERLRGTFLGTRPRGREAGLGLLLTPVVFLLVIGLLASIQAFAPWLHNVTENPLEQLLQTPGQAAAFAVVAALAGGLREEVQRAFALQRFDRHLGGFMVGLVVFNVAFGAGHALQGWDAAIATGVLGVFWSVVYWRRGSIVAPVISHVAFNVGEIVQYVLLS